MTSNRFPSGLRDRVRGTLIGLAAGDKNHGPSHMACRLAQSLAERECFDAEDIFERYLDWHRQGSFDTGRIFEMVLDRVMAGVPRRQAVDQAHRQMDGLTAGVNPGHRVAPLAMAAFIPDDMLEPAARQESALTHAHALAGETAAAVATLCRRLIRGIEWKEALEATAAERSPEVAVTLQPRTASRSELSAGGFAPETLRSAIWHLDEQRSFEEALSSSLKFAGRSNYCPVLVGAIGGARWGVGAIPEDELSLQPLIQRMQNVASALATAWGA